MLAQLVSELLRNSCFWAWISNSEQLLDLFHYTPPPPPLQQKGGHSETLLSTCIAHSNSADLLLSNNASDWLSGDFDNKNQ